MSSATRTIEVPPPGKPVAASRLTKALGILAFLAPLLALVAVFILLPVLGTLVNSFYRDISFQPAKYVTLNNYVSLWQDQIFWKSVRFTLFFVVVSVPLELALGLGFAMVINVRIPFRGLLRACVLIPWAVPAAIAAKTWRLIYEPSGLASFLALHLHLATGPVNWLGTGYGAFAAVVLADVWKTTPFVAIILLAGLQAIPEELYEQARIDGAGLVRSFLHVTAPLLKPVFIAALLFRTIDALRVFDVVYVLTGGGPYDSTNSLSQYAFKKYLSGDYGFGSAASMVLFVIAFVLALTYVKAGRFGTDVL